MTTETPAMNLRTALVRNTAWYGLVTFIGLGSGLVMSIVLARGLGPSLMGDYSYLLWALRMLTAVATLGWQAQPPKNDDRGGSGNGCAPPGQPRPCRPVAVESSAAGTFLTRPARQAACCTDALHPPELHAAPAGLLNAFRYSRTGR